MDFYTTEIQARHPQTGEIVTWAGPHVPGISFGDAQAYCDRHGLGYCKVTGRLIGEITVNFNTTVELSKVIDAKQN